MKRNDALKVITKILKNWEGSKLERRTSNEILTALEELGMLPPKRVIRQEGFTMQDGGNPDLPLMKVYHGKSWHRSWEK